MHRSFGLALALAGATSTLGGCSSPAEVSEDVGVAAVATAATSDSSLEELAETVVPDAKPVEFEDNSEQGEALREFKFSWPRQVSAEPELAALFEKERDAQLAEQKQNWQQNLEEFPGDECPPCKRMSYAREWKVVANLDRFLSLSADHYEYTGGAHGNYWFYGQIWDREAKAALDARDFFESPEALWTALEAPYCDGLNVERQKRFGDEAEVGTGYGWGCPGLEELTLLLGSSNGETFDRVGLLAAPYVAGSYAEGAYEVTLPITAQVLDVVKPDYQAAFSVQ